MPNQWCADGVSSGAKFVLFGLYGARYGPKIMRKMKNPRMTRPTMTLGERGKRSDFTAPPPFSFEDRAVDRRGPPGDSRPGPPSVMNKKIPWMSG